MNITVNITGLDGLAAALERIGTALERFGAPVFHNSVPALEASPPPVAAPPPASQPATASPSAAVPAEPPAAGAALSYDPVRRAITTFNLKHGKEATIAKLKAEFGVGRGQELTEDRWAEAAKSFTDAL